jgi:anti-sigma regulatory factor (Ser/Thr protein kinase)
VLLMKAFMDEVDVLSSPAGGAMVVMAKRHQKR